MNAFGVVKAQVSGQAGTGFRHVAVSWLNVAEIELSALSIQCLNRRIPDIDMMKKEVAAWELDRNNRSKIIDWLCGAEIHTAIKS